ncbi:nicotinamide-nucleotide amidase [Marinitoga hydrogenitolerans DSM 16785]|uniref:CinA-like protein n=1 Tax=Marinitoga hydrogenitolerans (strain DSM 16785 / JCM 12826 / AT1271) TaxID=1122195 RepID=A0A1M4X5T4_MARH1|nr:CinA family nicotinamide mononucleotide deamidase-related protein [Marinitoga hydrogenitolerans]SHE88878.1 nicotinamide-nucleotide amidase [Marinitoga hydrogenitolerans DSM 16785]
MVYIKISILSTGDELVEGDILNTTSKEISNILYSMGFEVSTHINVSDKKDDILSSLKFLFENNDVIIITGGLGSTNDDITKEVVAEFLNEKLVLNEKIYNNIIARYKKFGKTPNKFIKKQALLFENAKILKNDIGSAPGLYLTKNNKHYILLPGPPNEAIPMFKKYLNEIFSNFDAKKIPVKKIQFYNITESQLMSKLEKKLKNIKYSTKLELAIGPSIIFKDNPEKINDIVCFIEKNFSQNIVPNHFIKNLVEKLSFKNKTISTAESCTGGLVGKLITDIPGSSKVYKGSIIAYSNETKNKILNVDKNILEKYSAVSSEVVELMSKNIAQLLNTDFSISISGIAGPENSYNYPIGTVFFGFYNKIYDKIIIEKKIFSGNRAMIREKSAYYSLIRLLKLFL